MRALVLSIALATLGLSGCLADTDGTDAEGLEAQSMDPSSLVEAEPVSVEWVGHTTASVFAPFAHMRDTEPLVAPIQREGFVFEITEVPMFFLVELSWTPPELGEILIMVSSPKDAEAPREYFTESSGEEWSCLAIPPEEIVAGQWQIMAHPGDTTANADFTFKVTTHGGAASILDGPHSAAEAAATEEGEALPCEDMAEHAH